MTIRNTRLAYILHFVAYSAMLVAGVLYLIVPPETFAGVVEPWQTLTAASFIGVGGMLGCTAVLTKRILFEAAGLILMLGGMFVYLGGAVGRIAAGEVTSIPLSTVVVFVRVALFALVADRLRWVLLLLGETRKS